MNYYRNKNILITGGGGFIGSHLAEKLISLGSNVKIAQRSEPNFEDNKIKSKIEFVKSDLTIFEDCKKVVKNTDLIFDLAANVGSKEFNIKRPSKVFYDNVLISLNMLKVAAEQNVKGILCASSNNIYSTNIKLPYREADGFIKIPNENFIGYGWSKRVNELAADFFYKEFGLKVCVARIDNTYGPGASLKKDKINLLHYFIKSAINSEKSIEIWGNGEQKRSFIFVKDVVDALLVLMEKYKVSDPVNVSSGNFLSIKQVVEKIVKISEKKLEIKFKKEKKNNIPNRIMDNSKLVKKFNWKSKFSFEKGLKITYKWMQAKVR